MTLSARAHRIRLSGLLGAGVALMLILPMLSILLQLAAFASRPAAPDLSPAVRSRNGEPWPAAANHAAGIVSGEARP